MIKWEYYTADSPVEEAKDLWNTLGDDGWELVNFYVVPERRSVTGVFKREKKTENSDRFITGNGLMEHWLFKGALE